MNRRAVKSTGSLVLILFLAGCKGGSTLPSYVDVWLSSGNADALDTWKVSSFAPYESGATLLRNSAQFMRQRLDWNWGATAYHSDPLASARFDYAHVLGLTGQGQKVAVSDVGFRTTHEVFQDTTIDVVTSIDNKAHGTSVASIIAGYASMDDGDSADFTGVAPGAGLILGNFDTDESLALVGEAALAQDAVAWNNSWGYPNQPVSTASFNYIFGGNDGPRYLAALRNFAAQGVVVFALSNTDDLLESDLMPALPVLDSTLTAGWLAVGNAVPTFNSSGILGLARMSSACLEAATWCLMADGHWDVADNVGNTSYDAGTGASFAAPQVSGALALLAEAFPDLTPHDLRLRLLFSADNGFNGFVKAGSLRIDGSDFSHAYSTEFGHGFLDLRAALLPIGAATLQLQEGPVELSAATLSVGGAMGDAVAQGLSEVDVRVTDSLAAGFTLPADTLTTRSAPQTLSARLLSRQSTPTIAPTAAGRVTSFSDLPGTEIALPSEGDLSARLLLPATGSGPVGYGLGLSKHFGTGSSGIDLGLRMASDGGALFGLTGGDAGAGSAMLAVDFGVTQQLGEDGFVRLGASFGLADPAASGMLTRADTTQFDSFGLDLGQSGVFSKGDRLALSVSLPVAVTLGQAEALLPVVLESGAQTLSAVPIDLAPDSRQLDIGLSYLVPFGSDSDLKLDLQHSQNYGNQAGMTETAAAISIRFAF
jgi:hypothetical protein